MLSIPPERLNQFRDVTDPLLEVIVYWLKGSGDVPPTWDDVVGILRCPSINEPELADKIHRVYCDRTQEKEEREAQVCSGTDGSSA